MKKRRDADMPRIVERRPRRRRTCLKCTRMIVTTADRRLCPRCAAANEALLVGTLEEMHTILVLLTAVDG